LYLITADGGMAEHFRAPAARLVSLPPALDVRDASLVEPASVSWHALHLGDTGPGKRVAAADEGATLVRGGERSERLPRGYVFEPTLFTNVDPDSTLAQEEVFGPVQSILTYDDGDAGAIALANNSMFGLSGAVFGGDRDRALSVARSIRAGTISVNGGMWSAPDAPFGGYKQSASVGRWAAPGSRSSSRSRPSPSRPPEGREAGAGR